MILVIDVLVLRVIFILRNTTPRDSKDLNCQIGSIIYPVWHLGHLCIVLQ
jgi:hypothetical protein